MLIRVAVIVGAICGGFASAQPAATLPSVVTDADLPAQFFPILPWDFIHGGQKPFIDHPEGLETIAACGFTMAGFVQAQDLPLCEKLGLRAIIAPPEGRSPFADRKRVLTDEEIDAYVQALVAAGGDSKAVIGYFIMDEPGTRSFPFLARAVAAVRRHAPGKLAYINLYPGYATIGSPDTSQLGAASFAEYLERYVAEVKPQFISYDNYMVQYSDDMREPARAARYYRDLVEVRRVAMKHRLPFWNIVSANQIRPQTPPPSPANLMFQAYTTLAAGGRGVSWYTYYGRGYGYAPVDKSERRTETWGYLRMVNEQIRTLGPIMNRLRSTDIGFAGPLPAEELPRLRGRVIRSVSARTSTKTDEPENLPLMIGEFVGDDGADYAMIVNLSLRESVNIRPEARDSARRIDIVSAVDGQPWLYDPKLGYWLVPGRGALVRVE